MLRALRTAAGVSQAELGKRIGLPFQNVSRLESGRHEATVRTVNAYVRALGAELVLTVRPRPEPE